jgi:hypothetical protein
MEMRVRKVIESAINILYYSFLHRFNEELLVMVRRSGKKVFVWVMALCLIFSTVGVASAASVSDINGHWAESQISAWVDKGLIAGYEDGSFKPNNSITRAEFIALTNRSFGFSDEATISFSDVASSNWAYSEIAKAVKAGYITGYEDGTIGANKPISRQEVGVVVDRLLGLTNVQSAASSFTDSDSIALWAKGSVDAAVAKGILLGYAEDNSFKPGKSTTRAEAVVILDRAIASKLTAYNKAGTYGPLVGVTTIKGDVVINVADVTLQNLIITGNLLFAKGIGSGDAFLKNITVKGQTTIQGGGVNSIHFENSTLATVVIDKNAADGAVRIVAEGTTTVAQVNVNSPATIQETNVTGAGFGNVKLTDQLPAGSKVTLKGTFDNLEVVGSKINVDIPEGSVQKVTAAITATGMTLNLAKDAKIVSLILNAAAKLLGTGTIDSATLSAIAKAGSTFETQPTTIMDAGGTPAPTITPVPTSTPTPTPTTGPTTPTVYTMPTNLVANAGNSHIQLSWSSVTGATYYNVYQSTDNSNYHLVNVPATVTALTYDVTGLTNGILYYFKARAVISGTEGDYSNVVSTVSAVPGSAVNLGAAGNYVILAKAGVSNSATSAITGDIGVSPAAASYITGFALTGHSTFSTSSQVTGSVYAADYASPTPNNLTTAVNDMLTAYTDAAGRAVNHTELYAGDISNKTLLPGVYKWGTDVLINSGSVSLDGGANDVWIFQISGKITQANNTNIILLGGAQAKNIFWQAADTVSIGTTAHFEGTILAKTNITLGTGATVNGRLLAQTAVTLLSNTVVAPQ